MSKEALQAIKETKSEMDEKFTSNNELTRVSLTERGIEDDDDDSAIGTSSSLKSSQLHSVTDARSHLQISAMPPQTVKLCDAHKHTHFLVGKLEHIRPMTVMVTGKDRQSSIKCPSIGPTIVADDPARCDRVRWCNTLPNKPSQYLTSADITSCKNMNVFERLSSPSKVATTITARQRSSARLSLSMMRKQYKKETKPSFMFIQREGAKSAAPCLPSGKIRRAHNPHTTTRHDMTKSHRVMTCTDKSQISDDYHQYDHIPELECRPFEITPIGYDYRYAAMKYHNSISNQAHSEDESESGEIMKKAKLKCRQWLDHQLAVLTGTISQRNI